MRNGLCDIPELISLAARTALIRIPPLTDVPFTPRVRRLVDTSVFRRLARMSQLGLVALVYPAAQHSRLEHSLGVFRNALLYLQRLQYVPAFHAMVTRHDAEVFTVASLLHDIGHWPFCHAIEDMQLDEVLRHERLAERYLRDPELADPLRADWGIAPDEILALLNKARTDPAGCLLASMLSGPIDVDKVDYLVRDSLHAGVPYGQNFDVPRLIGSLCVNAAGDRLALTEKGKTAAEMMVFARYVMFSEVYWHHAVRAATAMLQRLFFDVRDDPRMTRLFCLEEPEFIRELQTLSRGKPAGSLCDGLFGTTRRIHKRVLEVSALRHKALHREVAHRPYAWLVNCAGHLADAISRRLGRHVDAADVLIDAPPTKLEVQFQVDIQLAKGGGSVPLKDISPVVRALAEEQFDRYVKRVRVFVSPPLRDQIRDWPDLDRMLEDAVAAANQDVSR